MYLQYAKVKDEDEITDADVSLIDAVFDRDESVLLETQGIGALLGELGAHITKGTVPSAHLAAEGVPKEADKASRPAPGKPQGKSPGKLPGLAHKGLHTSALGGQGSKKADSGFRSSRSMLRKGIFFRRSCRGTQFLSLVRDLTQ